jgi:3-deoxy-D-manno-octulosonic-acid transferase
MIRFIYILYSCLFYLALPLLILRLFWRSRNLPIYRQGISQRLGFYSFSLDTCIWIHAVSVGEVIAALPLIRQLQAIHTTLPLLVTTITPTGRERVRALLGNSVLHVYLPYDVPCVVKRFLSAMHPCIGIIMETELWPNLLTYCHLQQIPICLVNARLSPRSTAAYARILPIMRNMLSKINYIAAQSEKDANNFLSLGAEPNRVKVTGNMKFDLSCSPELYEASSRLREKLGKEKFIWIAASTHQGEEESILAAHQQLRLIHPNALLILVPRHPDRFESVAQLCERLFVTSRHSHHSQSSHFISDSAVYLGDTMGDLLLLYGAADAAFVGGSLVNKGGHNLLEPALMNKPILSGPSLFNFAEMSELFLEENALFIVNNTDELVNKLIILINNPEEAINTGKRAYSLIENNRGAVNNNLLIIKKILF